MPVLASYPTQIASFVSRTDAVDTIFADHINALQAEVRAIQIALGTSPAGASSTVRARISAAESTLNSLAARFNSSGLLPESGVVGLIDDLVNKAALAHTHPARDVSAYENIGLRHAASSLLSASSTSSTTFVDLGGPVATFLVPPSGFVTILFGTNSNNNTAMFQSLMSFDVDDVTGGGTPTSILTASDQRAVYSLNPATATNTSQMGNFYSLGGLTPGNYVRVTAKYRVTGATGLFQRRYITVIPSL